MVTHIACRTFWVPKVGTFYGAVSPPRGDSGDRELRALDRDHSLASMRSIYGIFMVRMNRAVRGSWQLVRSPSICSEKGLPARHT